MKLDWRNVGKGLSAIAQAKMDTDAAKILAREQAQQFTPEQLADYQANYERTGDVGTFDPRRGLTYGGTPYRTSDSTAASYDQPTPRGISAAPGITVAPQYRLGGLSRATEFSPEEVGAANKQAELDYWRSMGSLGADMVKEREQSRVRDIQMKGLERQEAEAQKQEVMQKDMAPILEKLPTLEYGSDEYKSAHVTIKSSLLKGMGAVEGSKAYANIVLSNSAERKEREEIEDKAAMAGGKSPEDAAKYLSSTIGKTVVFESKKDGRTYLIQDVNGDGRFDANDIAGSAKTIGSFKTGDWVKTGAPQFFEAYSKMGPEIVKLRVQHEFAKDLKQMELGAKAEAAKTAGLRRGGVIDYVGKNAAGERVSVVKDDDGVWVNLDGSRYDGPAPYKMSANERTSMSPKMEEALLGYAGDLEYEVGSGTMTREEADAKIASYKERLVGLIANTGKSTGGVATGVIKQSDIPTVKSKAEADALPKGTQFYTPDGRLKVR